MTNTLYLPSTPLNILISAAHASHFCDEQSSEIWLIDQKKIDNNIYVAALEAWSDSPFKSVKVFSGSASGWAKKHERTLNFKKMVDCLKTFCPDQVAVGSDRRVEFQFIMHCLKSKNHPVKGIYLDDGLYSYAGRPSVFFKDKVNAWLKKLFYGTWWEEPETVGASSKINQAWLFSPEQAVAAITCHKDVQALEAGFFQTMEMQALSQEVMKAFKEPLKPYADFDILWFIPHPNNIEKMSGYEARLKKNILKVIASGKKVAVKYHPRVGDNDPLELQNLGVEKIVPAPLASEFILPVLGPHCHIIGDVGTAMLTCKWLRPDLEVTALMSSEDSFQKRFIPLLERMGIQVETKLSVTKERGEFI
uniref:Uncharacterized protein n=1 Tax=Hydrogenovibrio crunogenus (strain DSM 25203 / XCL-2) TaxID=317025 RepID=Q31FG8_HYDCU